jgi:oxalate decarboxylase/phosphoglucose isomerase-like protein (cupin superfamily)
MSLVRLEKIDVHRDNRGELHKLFPFTVTGEVYLVVTRPKEERGDHFHPHMSEWFTCLSGNGQLSVQHSTGGPIETIEMIAGFRYFVPSGVAHKLTNTGAKDWTVLAGAERGFDPNDTIKHKIR